MTEHRSALLPAVPTEVYDTYWRFAAERQEIFFRKLEGVSPPWTYDPILRWHKFTNAYRAADRVSQFLIRYVMYEGDQHPDELFFRIILFKLFNKIDTWELLMAELGSVTYAGYSFDHYDAVLTRALQQATTIYSAAYIMPANQAAGYKRKHSGHLRLLEQMMMDEVPSRIQAARSMQEVFDTLYSYPSIGGFLAYQYAVDLNYSTLINFSENDFVVAGPGARDGIRKCFLSTGGLTDVEIIRLVTDLQEKEFERLGLTFRSLWGRRLHLIDCQNLFCEVNKYARVAHPEVLDRSGRTRIKQRYLPQGGTIDYWFPPKWHLNEKTRG